jgi:hypothetical protein
MLGQSTRQQFRSTLLIALVLLTLDVAPSLAQGNAGIFQEWKCRDSEDQHGCQSHMLYKHNGRACGYYDVWASGRTYRRRFAGRAISPEKIEVEYSCVAVSDGRAERCNSSFLDTEMWQATRFWLLVCDGRLKDVYGGGDCPRGKDFSGPRRVRANWFGLSDLTGEQAWIAQCLTDPVFPPIESRGP